MLKDNKNSIINDIKLKMEANQNLKKNNHQVKFNFLKFLGN